jgi:hypothetical protein
MLARPEGLEPPAYWFEANRSIQLSYGRGSGDRDLMVSPPSRAKMPLAMDNEQLQAAIKKLEDAMVVMAYMEARQTDRLLRQEKEIVDLSLARARVDQSVLRLREESAVFERRTEQNLAEINRQTERADRLRRGSWHERRLEAVVSSKP